MIVYFLIIILYLLNLLCNLFIFFNFSIVSLSNLSKAIFLMINQLIAFKYLLITLVFLLLFRLLLGVIIGFIIVLNINLLFNLIGQMIILLFLVVGYSFLLLHSITLFYLKILNILMNFHHQSIISPHIYLHILLLSLLDLSFIIFLIL